MLRSLAIVALGTTVAGAGMVAGFMSGATAGGVAGVTAGCIAARLRSARLRGPGPLPEKRAPVEE